MIPSLPASYALCAVSIGATAVPTLAVVAVAGASAVFALVTHDISAPKLTYRLDLINAVYLVGLAGSYYVIGV